MTTPATEPTTRTLETRGAVIAYDVRPSGSNGKPMLVLIGSPMGAAGFTTLAGHFADRTVVTYDPRGVERSKKTDGAPESTPEEHADDLARLIEHLGGGPVDLFASSGGAVNALALATLHPEKLRTVVAHEPPLVRLVPDAEAAERVTRDMHATYQRGGVGPAMAKFIALVSYVGPLTEEYLQQPAPDPAMFGLPTEDDGRRDDALLAQNLLSCTLYEPELATLRGFIASGSPRLVIAVGQQSEGQLASRAARALAQKLGTEAEVFPSDHGGFLGGEYGQRGDPDAFAAKLRQVVDTER
ncbi:MAG: alpha/beta hydrolase [Trueperaceae bacterium]